MTEKKLPQAQLSQVQLDIIDVVRRYPGHFSRSGLAKMLVGSKSWQDADFSDYGRFSSYHRKDITYQVDILLQQGFLVLDGREYLLSVP